MYADFAYYTSAYCGALLTKETFPAAERQAAAYIDCLTFGRLQRGAAVDDAVKKAVCAVAEVVDRYTRARAERPAGLSAANTDGESESYRPDAELAAERVQGYLAAGTRREALQQLAFAIGAVVDCSRSDLIRISPAPARASGMIAYDRKFQDGSKVTLNPLITAVAVTAHRYQAEDASSELYKDTLEPGTYQVTFSAPAVADSLTVTGATLAGRGVNRCTLAVSKAGEVCVTGRKYVDSTIILRRAAANLPPNAQDNELTVTDATLVSPDRATAVANRVLDYYAQRYEQTFRMIAGDEKLADRLIVQSFGGEMVRGVLTKLEFDLTGGFVADAKVVGRRLPGTAAAYAGDEIHAGERSLI